MDDALKLKRLQNAHPTKNAAWIDRELLLSTIA
jgi:hypothetical protein